MGGFFFLCMYAGQSWLRIWWKLKWKWKEQNHLSSKISLHVFCKIKFICENGGEKGRSSKPPSPKVKVVLLNTVQVGDRCVLYFYFFLHLTSPLSPPSLSPSWFRLGINRLDFLPENRGHARWTGGGGGGTHDLLLIFSVDSVITQLWCGTLIFPSPVFFSLKAGMWGVIFVPLSHLYRLNFSHFTLYLALFGGKIPFLFLADKECYYYYCY